MGTAKRAPASPPSIHQLKVTLKGIRPPIWRRIQVRSTITLAELHDVIQATMGWYDSHLHEFRVGGTAYGDPDMLEDDLFGDMGTKSERGARLKAVAPNKGNKLRYLYDFGDSWDHDLLVEEVLPPVRGTR